MNNFSFLYLNKNILSIKILAMPNPLNGKTDVKCVLEEKRDASHFICQEKPPGSNN
jgi:hypothetical protein